MKEPSLVKEVSSRKKLPKKLTARQKKKVRAKINRLLDEKNYSEAAKLMVAMAVIKIDPDEFARQLVEKLREAKTWQKKTMT